MGEGFKLALKSVDHGYERVKRQMATREERVKTGYPASVSEEQIKVAAYNEFGTHAADGSVRNPARPTVRPAIDENVPELVRYSAELASEYIEKGGDIAHYLGKLGLKASTLIKNKIRSNVPPPNAPSTIAQKGSSHTLIDTAAMLQAVTYEVEGHHAAGSGHEGGRE